MKLVEDDGTLIDSIPDDAAVLCIHSDRRMRAIMPTSLKNQPPHALPIHARLVRGLLAYLQYQSGVETVMRYAPATRNEKHRHH